MDKVYQKLNDDDAFGWTTQMRLQAAFDTLREVFVEQGLLTEEDINKIKETP